MSAAQLREYLEGELMLLRQEVRVWVAANNAPRDRWFGGSEELQAAAAFGLLTSIIMRVRKLLDTGRRNEVGLCSLYEALRMAGHANVGDTLRALPSVQHLRYMADKTIAHAKKGEAAAPSLHAEGLTAEQLRPNMVFEAVDRISRAYLDVLAPQLHSLDPTRLYPDPLFRHMPTVGLPGIDFTPSMIFGPDAPDVDDIGESEEDR